MTHQTPKHVETVEGISPDAIPSWVFEREEPLVLRGLVDDWPAVPEGDGDLEQLETYLSKFWTAKPVTAYVAPTEVAGRFGYNGAFNGFNFRSGNAPLEDILQRLREQADPENKEPLSIYVGSTPIAGWLPGFEKANTLKIPGDPLVNFWLGNRTTVSAHYDFPSNMACVVYGRREFTLFPTD
ncbi:MAG: cupin-like domain-containing protein, partial [Halieaceae bacterium]|nr:cupin-like domain-containing protein [Halieaceae bacterium]